MKVLRRMLAAAAVLCLLMTLLPCAFADTDARFENRTWNEVTEEFLAQAGALETGTIGIGYYNTVTGEEQYYNADTYITVGSVYKVPLNMIYCERISKGEMTLETPVFGIPYETLLRGTIIDSNNDYAKTLWDNVGSYHLYREQIAPYMGEDAATVNAKFYENNFFTARQMITCLRTLYENPDRFPYLVDVMKQAEPTNYFHRDEHRYEIAHKYGYNNADYHYYVADSGIFYTTEPFLLVVFTDNSPSAFDLLARYAVLMCDYTEYNTVKRLKSGAADRAVETLAFPAAPEAVAGGAADGSSEELPVLDMDLNTFAKLLGVLALMLFGLGICVKLGRHAGYVTLVPAVIVLAAGLLISRGLLQSGGAAFFAASKGNGAETVESFFSELEQGDYAAACERLNGYTSLGLEKEPGDAYGARIYEALRRSYSHTMNGGGAEDQTASYSVTLRHLSLPVLQNTLREQTRAILNGYEAQRPADELFDAGYNFRSEVIAEAYAQAFDTALAQPESCYAEDTVTVALSYSIKGWKINPDAALLNAIDGK